MADHRVFWSSFDDPHEADAWMKAGTWSLATGAAVQSSTTGSAYLRLPMLVQRAYVAAGVTPMTLGVGMAPAVGIRVRDTHEYGCAIFKMGTVQSVAETDQTDNDIGGWAGTYPGASLGIGQSLVGANNCSFASGAAMGTRQSNYAGGTTLPSGYVELSMQNASASYAYVFVVETTP